MVQIVGKYDHVNNEGFLDYLKAVGTPAEFLNVLNDSKPTITITEAAGKWTVTVSNSGKDSSSTFTLGEPYDETMPNGLVLKSVTKREGDKFIIETEVMDGNKAIRVYEFSDAGIVVRLSDSKSGKKATRTYKRV